MKSLIQQLPHIPQHAAGAILVVGAGGGAELPALRALGSQRLILVEAHPRQAEDLARHIDASRGEEVWSLAITGMPAQQATLHILNNMRHSSLKLPIALEQHYPNLRVAGEIQVPARSLGESIQSLGLETDSHFLLIIDAPGQASELLDATPASLLQSFAWIIVRCGAEPLYAGAKGARDTLAVLKEIGFEVESENADALYPQTEVLLKRDDSRVRLGRLEAQLQQFDEERAAQMKTAAARESQVKVLTQERDEQAKLATQHKAELDKTAQTATEQQKLAADRHAQIQKLTLERDEQAKLATQLKAELDKTAQTSVEQQKLAADRHAQIQKLTQERDEQAKLAAQLKAELDKTAQTSVEQQKLAADRHAQIQKLTLERDEQAKLTTQHKAELDTTAQTAAEQQKLAADRHAQIQKLTLERDEQAKLAAQLKAELDKVGKQSQERAGRITQLENEHNELGQRQARLSQEMVKAEAQIDLIKDVLLREPGL